MTPITQVQALRERRYQAARQIYVQTILSESPSAPASPEAVAALDEAMRELEVEPQRALMHSDEVRKLRAFRDQVEAAKQRFGVADAVQAQAQAARDALFANPGKTYTPSGLLTPKAQEVERDLSGARHHRNAAAADLQSAESVATSHAQKMTLIREFPEAARALGI